MNINQLRTFVAVVEHGSFSGAARATGVSQPAVTTQIQSLEADLGAALLQRRYRKVEITEAGEALLPVAKRVLGELDEARAAIELLSSTIGGHLDVAASTTPGQYLLPGMLSSFLRAYPDVSISLRIRDTTEVVRLLESGEANLAMTGARVTDARVDWAEAGVDRLVVIAPADSPLRDEVGIPLTRIAEQLFVVREQGSGTRMVFESALKAVAIDPADLQVIMELGTGEAIVSAIEGGMGIGVVSGWAADKAVTLGTVVALDVEGFPLERPLYIAAPRGVRSRAAEALLSLTLSGHTRPGPE